ncbi:lipid-A-disaccharide synthase [Candidatus Pelagibacter communis]|uniref:Lipid-A-disaccharide synthase n=1 Tax=Pelagibacter ubique (strain HTCC1062) TaxID=335992 RepID=Q4FM57_PELUB|nr:lipid-A-disaccharide synthase [Candidatus Pelagibacter ubique]AAZ21732.1 lipid-A-disaccharide synthase (lpxB) [Candidatus Pelagibacter ubique HTCC1062]
MKKIFILTGEPSGDKLASTVISKLKMNNPNIEYLSVGGTHIKKLGIKSIFDLKEITYLGFTSVLFNIFKIRKKINKTVEEIIKFNPDILFSVDSPDFTLRVAEKVKNINHNIKIIHYVAPQVWVWRKNRVKKIKKFIDHILLLFNFEKKYFDEENIKNTFVGHPLIEKKDNVITSLDNLISKDKKIISLFPGSRKSETSVLLPILLNFIKLMNKKKLDHLFVFHATDENKEFIINKVKKTNLDNIDIISDEDIKNQVLSNSIFAVSKSGTISLQISSANIPSIIIYKLGFINFMIFKLLVNVRFANIINIINDKEVIPELLQKECNAEEIYKTVTYFLKNPELIEKQLVDCKKTLEGIKSKSSSSSEAALILNNYLVS